MDLHALTAWAKTDRDGRPSHHLAHHSMDVAAVLERLLTHPVLSARVATAAGRGLSTPEVAWLAAFAFLHDIGKLSPAFQAKARPDLPRGGDGSHLSQGVLWLSRIGARDAPRLMDGAAADLLAPLLEVPEDCEEAWLRALLAHHGRPVPLRPDGRPSDPGCVFADVPGYDWRAEDARLGAMLRVWFPGAAMAPDLLTRAPFVHLFAGLLALADWIGSDETAFPHVLPLDERYGALARHRAREALTAIGLSDPAWPDAPPSFEALTGHPAPRGVQGAMDVLPREARLAILEAETGSGKTEAALLYFAHLRSAGAVEALYFAVPTRAAASQLQDRIRKAMERIGGPDAVLAVPGMLRAGAAEGTRLPGFDIRWDDDRRHWSAEHPTRFLASPVAVGTIDQALMGGLQVKHAPLRAAALARSLLVIDEVHASDAYMNAIARPLVRGHVALGGHALLMSATLGGAARVAWLGRPRPSRAEAEAAPYPALWHDHAADPIAPPRAARAKTVLPRPVPTMAAAEAARLAVEAAEAGARVLVIRNTVDVAVETWRAVTEGRPDLCLSLGGRPALHHSRFAAEDRRALDAAVEAALSPDRPEGGRVVVGTQTLEQSLDIDADLLITDLCPMDVLLQRVGRLHRHASTRRPAGFEEARVHVLLPERGLDALARGPAFENGLGAWRDGGALVGIYADLRALEATRRRLREPSWTIPADNRRLVEGATHPDRLLDIQEEMGWDDHGSQIHAKALAEAQAGDVVTLDRASPFPAAFPGSDEAVRTRLGAMGPSFTLPEDTVGPFGTAITTIAPPARWCHGITGDEPVHVSQEDDRTQRFQIGETTFLYGTEGLTCRKQN